MEGVMIRDTRHRNAAMFEAFVRGARLKDLAAEAGLSDSRASQIILKQAKRLRSWWGRQLGQTVPDEIDDLLLWTCTAELRQQPAWWLNALASWRARNGQ